MDSIIFPFFVSEFESLSPGAAFASWGAVFRFRVLGWEAQRAAFFRFRGRIVLFDELRGGTCILAGLGRRFHLVGS